MAHTLELINHHKIQNRTSIEKVSTPSKPKLCATTNEEFGIYFWDFLALFMIAEFFQHHLLVIIWQRCVDSIIYLETVLIHVWLI
ncbi:unnamed protein product [Acanthoscelides obtectus]|uniref:Uncharacterized protein n=1 Tax=Acanthoscelides obtectus TaxID=200917 RepID=A0A9P0Q8E9_ACAOB|nr:unnamed protein product [Acanthoscelides obtectus]CAK1657166.1 hypothetical protein AOBTE_LOCUS20170 [Acanthoscelides obtectus]